MVRAAIRDYIRRCHAYKAKHPDCEQEAGGCELCGYVDDLVDGVIRAVKEALDARWDDVAKEAE